MYHIKLQATHTALIAKKSFVIERGQHDTISNSDRQIVKVMIKQLGIFEVMEVCTNNNMM